MGKESLLSSMRESRKKGGLSLTPKIRTNERRLNYLGRLAFVCPDIPSLDSLMRKYVFYLIGITLLLFALAGVLATICVLMEAIYLMSGGI